MSSPRVGSRTDVRHLVIGEDTHGVVRHGVLVARSCEHEVVRRLRATEVHEADLAGASIVHIPFTDRLFGPSCEVAVEEFQLLANRIDAVGAMLSITLHDVPHETDALSLRRQAAYARVLARARGIVVNSRVELVAIEDLARQAHALTLIELPVEAAHFEVSHPTDRDVVVLGFVFPDRGHAEVLRALPAGCGLVALGRTSAGHEDLEHSLADLADRCQRPFALTGFVPDADLGSRLSRAAVPVAPNTHVSASASIATWLAHGRRPLAPSTGYTRELLDRMPGSLTLYEPADAGALTAAITRAVADPASTWLAADVVLGPVVDDVGRRYRAHLGCCVPPSAAGGIVSGNRWDLLPPARPVTVSVVIPYFEAQRQLDLVLAALQVQTLPAQRLSVVVADDGSAEPPDLSAAGPLRITVVRQGHDGFGAARARNLGARAADGEVVAFLDGDTVPEPDYLERLIRLPSVDPAALTVGRRRHGSFAGWDARDVRLWSAGERAAPSALDEPAWLLAAYRDSANLLAADGRSYRHIISAVLCVHRTLFDRLGGFDERFRSYGGEDWEFAHRAWLAGALFAHVPDAVAWHDGPDWGARPGSDRAAAKNAETLALAQLLPDPQLRGGGQWLPYCQAVVTMPATDAAAVLATARSAFLAGADCRFWLTGDAAAGVAAALGDPRICAGAPTPDVRARAAVTVQVRQPADLAVLPELIELATRTGIVSTPALKLTSTRAAGRCGLHGGDDLIARLFGRHDRSAPQPLPDIDLAACLAALGQSSRRS